MHYAGIDIGSIYFKLVVLDEELRPVNSQYRPHQGNPGQVLDEELRSIPPDSLIAASGMPLSGYPRVDIIRARIAGVRHARSGIRNIIDVGGGSLTLIELDEDGNFRNFSGNSLCAAGTGSFLDEQAGRMGLSYEEISTFDIDEAPPSIATRCAVFAKSDLIHRQQEGHSRGAMWSGLCRGMVTTMLQTLLKGKPLTGRTAIIGGVALNRVVLHWLEAQLGDLLVTIGEPHLASARGAALEAYESHRKGISLHLAQPEKEASVARQKPLALRKTSYPSFAVAESYVDDKGTEVRVSRAFDPTDQSDQSNRSDRKCWLGIDVGSTSTKAVLIDDDQRIILDLYRRTNGAPIDAVKALLSALQELQERYRCTYDIAGMGTTGSGRKLIGNVFGADSVVNEITAHVTGASHTDPEIDTIFEIGGQDAKYIRTKNGHIFDSSMNYVCAAGTGSFVEEQARKLGVNLFDIGDRAMGISPPVTSDRCTVFMEQDVGQLVRQGHGADECIAAVLYSVVQNYLNRVVGNRYVSRKKIFFQGATARNRGLVAAFENLLDVEMVVSPYCHVMGALGVALCTREEVLKSGLRSRFLGLAMAEKEVAITKGECRLCQNVCAITYAKVDGTDYQPSWGYLCGREPEETAMKKSPHADLLSWRQRAWQGVPAVGNTGPTIGIPRSLTTYTFYPLWQAFFQEMGFRVVLSSPSDQMIKEDGIRMVGADFCYPVKLLHGHIRNLLEKKADHIFLPYMISDEPNRATTNSLFCPYVEAAPSVVTSSLSLNGEKADKMLRPIVDLRDIPGTIKDLTRCMEPLGIRRTAVKKAWEKAWEIQKGFIAGLWRKGAEAIEQLEQEGRIGLVLIGRPYNIHDAGANLSLPRKIAEYGFTVIPLDLLAYDPDHLGHEFANIYWSSGQRIMGALKIVKQHPRLFPVYFTNFNCGPDSLLLSYAEEVMDGKPTLILELDEHGADSGYITRIEAFLDVLRNYPLKKEPVTFSVTRWKDDEFKNRCILIPPIHPLGSRLFAASFRGAGYKAAALPQEDSDSFSAGKAVCRGSECLPTSLTVGVLLKYLREHPDGRYAWFMPTTEGPCRFGQYRLFQQTVLKREGFDIPILSPSASNSYQGLEDGLRRTLWRATLAGDLVYKMGCRIRPYERNRGETDAVVEKAVVLLESALEREAALAPEIRRIAAQFAAIPRDDIRRKPLVGVVGEIYIRSNHFSNQDLVRDIEGGGGEAWVSPITEWFLYTTTLARRNAARDMAMLELAGSAAINFFLKKDEADFFEACGSVLEGRHEPSIDRVIDAGRAHVPESFQGEAIVTVGRAILFKDDGAELIVNVAPFGCMPGTISAAIFKEIERTLQLPILNIFYEGAGDQNAKIGIFLNNLQKAKQEVFRETADTFS